MECFKLLFDHLAWIKLQFLSGKRDSRKAGSLWEMMRGVGGVRKSIDQSWLAKGLGLGLLCWGFMGVQEERCIGKTPALLKSAQWYFHHDNAPVHNSILVTDFLTKIGIKTVPHPPKSVIFNWIVCITSQYLEPSNSVQIKLLMSNTWNCFTVNKNWIIGIT